MPEEGLSNKFQAMPHPFPLFSFFWALPSDLSLPPEPAFNNPLVFPVAGHTLQGLVNLTAGE